MSNYLVTGAAGFIAHRVCELLLAEGHQVTGVDNLNDAYDPRLKQWRLDRLMSDPGFTFLRSDIGQSESLAPLDGQRFDAALNLAARAGVRQSTENPWVYVDTNVTGTLNVLEFCRRNRIGKFVLSSTSSLYGANNPLPYAETANTDQPLSPYAASKKGAEAMSYSYHHLYGIDVTVYRYFTVYGPAGRPDMSVFRFIQWIDKGLPVLVFGDGGQSRDFTYVDDIARGTIAGLRPVGYDVFNLGSDRPVKLMDMLRTVERRLGKQANIEYRNAHPADVPATWADISKARKVLGWEPKISYEEGVGAAADWYMTNRDMAQSIYTG